MNIRRRVLTHFLAISVMLSGASLALASGTLVRWHKMGEDDGGSNGAISAGSVDTPINGSDTTALDLFATNSPVFRTIAGRQDGNTGLGIEFAAASQQYLSGFPLNWPQESPLSSTQGGHQVAQKWMMTSWSSNPPSRTSAMLRNLSVPVG